MLVLLVSSRQVSAMMPGSLWARLLIKVPATMRFVLDGEMPSYLAKDLILQIVGILVLLGRRIEGIAGKGKKRARCWLQRSPTVLHIRWLLYFTLNSGS